MSHAAPIAFDHVWKRYQLGSQHDSLRDAIPALLKSWTSRNGHELQPGEFWALRDVSFHVKQGEMLGIIGPNGAGKSTALKLLSRICKETKGEVAVRGRLAALIEIGAGFHPDLSGRENIYLNGAILGFRHKEIDRLFDSIVAFSELERFLDMPVKRYSSGMTVRLGFAIAAHLNPEVLLVDEVLAVGDLAFQRKCYQRILDLKEQGTTIILISHNLEAVQRLCDRALLLHKGEVAREGTPADVILHYREEVLRARPNQQAAGAVGNGAVAGDGVRLHAPQLFNGSGEARDAFETGSSMRIHLRFSTDRVIRDPSVTVTLERLDGLICHEASTLISEVSWRAWNGDGALTLEYPELNLMPNTYQVVVSVCEGKNLAPLIRLRNCCYFHVTSDQHTRGTVHLDHVWTLRKANGGIRQ